jgi:glycogen operon protein
VKLIAEPWDCGPGGYQVGCFPPGWAEWNDQFRDTVRAFWKGEVAASRMAPRLCASADHFNRSGRKPSDCVNFVTAHDGFTLNDLVSYNDKHNERNGEDNKDGTSDNRSSNGGVEGPTDDPAIIAVRARMQHSLLATLMLAQGTPMMLARDETGRTQQGNNNAYCQDNEVSWLNWDVPPAGQSLLAFVRKLTSLRHTYPVLRRNRFLTGEYNEALGIKDLTWINACGSEMRAEDWADEHTRCFGMMMDGRAQPTGIGRRGEDSTMLMVLNGHHDVVQFTLPECTGGSRWRRLVDTSMPDDDEAAAFPFGETYAVIARSLLLFVLDQDDRVSEPTSDGESAARGARAPASPTSARPRLARRREDRIAEGWSSRP